MSQNIDMTFNRSMNNRTTNNITISLKNDNYLTAGRLLCVVEHSLTDQPIGQYSASDVRTDAPFASTSVLVQFIWNGLLFILRGHCLM